MTESAQSIQISLLSHTNVGKTSLARTLLREDIGEVGDRPHVTELAESHVLIESSSGDSLVLWDTPGFGDSGRLFKRLQQSGQPIGWLLSQVWDRFTDRPFWCSQQAMKTARDASDVVLYVVSAGESPGSAAYVDVELQILGWIGKPIVLLLNQLGPPRGSQETGVEVERWRAHVAAFPLVRSVLSFDAFARCWVQESTLLEHVRPLLKEEQQPAFDRLREAWKIRNREVFDRSMRILAKQLAAVALDDESIAERTVKQKARAWLGSVTSTTPVEDATVNLAQQALARRLDVRVRQTTEELVRLHGLTGRATEKVLQGIGREFSVQRVADADKAGLVGGIVSGALAGLAADLAAGGLTFGAGALIGGVLGAFGTRELTRAYNLARGGETGTVRWSSEFLNERTAAAVIRYLAVAHFGRGRGEFVSSVEPAHWNAAVAAAIEVRRAALDSAWSSARERISSGSLEEMIEPTVAELVKDVLIRLYPDCAPVFVVNQKA
jgi:GTPase SAR1 family protein